LRDYFITEESSYDAGGQSIVLQLNPTLFPSLGKYAILRTTGSISSLADPIGPTATWTGGSHPSGWSVSAPTLGVEIFDGVPYSCLLVTVSV
jgi:hypothetical protein